MSDTMSNSPADSNGNPSASSSTNNVLKLWDQIKHFKPAEFDDPTVPGSGVSMNIEFVKIIDGIRDDCGFPFKIDSGWRSPDHNATVGGKTDSAHMETPGCASDIGCTDSIERFALISSAIKRGIKRIGIGQNFVHLDMSYSLPQSVAWLYPPKAIPTKQIPNS